MQRRRLCLLSLAGGAGVQSQHCQDVLRAGRLEGLVGDLLDVLGKAFGAIHGCTAQLGPRQASGTFVVSDKVGGVVVSREVHEGFAQLEDLPTLVHVAEQYDAHREDALAMFHIQAAQEAPPQVRHEVTERHGAVGAAPEPQQVGLELLQGGGAAAAPGVQLKAQGRAAFGFFFFLCLCSLRRKRKKERF